MRTRIGEVEALYRYPVKSMAGELIPATDLGWHGLSGDRRLAFRRIAEHGGFPWLTASKLPELLCFKPQRLEAPRIEGLPSHVRTPEGADLGLFSPELAADVGQRHGAPLEMVHLDRGIFDEASVSLITSATVAASCELSAQHVDVRRFRPNILLASSRSVAFEEDDWLGGVLSFGEGHDAAAVFITNRDERCVMVNFDPDSAHPSPEVLKAIVQKRDNMAGVYGAVARRGRLAVGQPVFFEPSA